MTLELTMTPEGGPLKTRTRTAQSEQQMPDSAATVFPGDYEKKGIPTPFKILGCAGVATLGFGGLGLGALEAGLVPQWVLDQFMLEGGMPGCGSTAEIKQTEQPLSPEAEPSPLKPGIYKELYKAEAENPGDKVIPAEIQTAVEGAGNGKLVYLVGHSAIQSETDQIPTSFFMGQTENGKNYVVFLTTDNKYLIKEAHKAVTVDAEGRVHYNHYINKQQQDTNPIRTTFLDYGLKMQAEELETMTPEEIAALIPTEAARLENVASIRLDNPFDGDDGVTFDLTNGSIPDGADGILASIGEYLVEHDPGLENAQAAVPEVESGLGTSTPEAKNTPEATIPAEATQTTVVVQPTVTEQAQVTAESTQEVTLEQWATIDRIDPTLLQQRKQEYAKALGVPVESIVLDLQTVHGPQGDFVKAIDKNTGVALFIATEVKDSLFKWDIATPGEYWALHGKLMGVSVGGQTLKNDDWQRLVMANFNRGILSLSGIVRPGPDIAERKPANASKAFSFAEKNDMTMNFQYVAEPDKFPKTVSASNVDTWLAQRLKETADVRKSTGFSGPIFLVFNEGFDKGSNPLKDKHQDKWPEEYIYQVLVAFMSQGLIPNNEFVVEFNEGGMYGDIDKQDTVLTSLTAAREAAYQRILAEHPEFKSLLAKAGIKSAADLKVLMGCETHVVVGDGTTKLRGNNTIIDFERIPAIEQIDALANKFAGLGGIIMTEINPFGEGGDKTEVLRRTDAALKSNPNVRGAILWNILTVDTEGKIQYRNPGSVTDVFNEIMPLFNPDGTPSASYYELLK